MANFGLDNSNWQRPTHDRRSMARWLMKLSGGAIADEQQANTILVFVAIIAAALAVILFIAFGTSEGNSMARDYLDRNPQAPGGKTVGL